MAFRKIKVTPPISGNGVSVEEGGEGPLKIDSSGIGTNLLTDEAVAPEKLEGGTASPGNNKVYGTDGSGVLGFQDFPSELPATINEVQLTAAGATIDLQYLGSTAPSSFVQSPTGTFTLTVPAGVKLDTGCFIGSSSHVAGSGGSATWTLKIVDTDGRFVNFIPAIFDYDTFTQFDLQLNGHNPTQDDSVAGTITSFWQNMGYDNFMVLFKFINRIEPA